MASVSAKAGHLRAAIRAQNDMGTEDVSKTTEEKMRLKVATTLAGALVLGRSFHQCVWPNGAIAMTIAVATTVIGPNWDVKRSVCGRSGTRYGSGVAKAASRLYASLRAAGTSRCWISRSSTQAATRTTSACRHNLERGERTRPLDLRGRDRAISSIEMVYRALPNRRDREPTVCVEGLVAHAAPLHPAQAPETGSSLGVRKFPIREGPRVDPGGTS